MQVPDPGRDVAGGRAANGNDAQVLQAVRNEDDTGRAAREVAAAP
jgi:hypothetical protein